MRTAAKREDKVWLEPSRCSTCFHPDMTATHAGSPIIRTPSRLMRRRTATDAARRSPKTRHASSSTNMTRIRWRTHVCINFEFDLARRRVDLVTEPFRSRRTRGRTTGFRTDHPQTWRVAHPSLCVDDYLAGSVESRKPRLSPLNLCIVRFPCFPTIGLVPVLQPLEDSSPRRQAAQARRWRGASQR